MERTNARPSLRIGLAAARNAPSVEERLETVDRFLADAGAQGVAIVCFPEAYIPGLRGEDFPVPPPDQRRQHAALEQVRDAARRYSVRRPARLSPALHGQRPHRRHARALG
jgi:predicted amidohydrolase